MARSPAAVVNHNAEADLVEYVGEFYADPLGFVLAMFPWGEKGGPLADYPLGPDTWQRELLKSVGDQISAAPENYTIRQATASGHGVGKSAVVAWLILWAMSTRPHLSCVVTANTSNQLNSKTWRELALWLKKSLNSHWFRWSATSFRHVDHPETWFANAVPNTEQNSESFAGLHAEHVLMIFDEASAIPDAIWDVAQGATTTTKSMWFVFGNMTRNVGSFRECFDQQKHRWTTRQIDSRTCRMANQSQIQEWVSDYGEDSDFVRVRVRGIPPRSGDMQFISSETVFEAMQREIPFEAYYQMPVVLGVDVARYGEDKSVIVARAGRKVLEVRKFRELDTMSMAGEVAKAIHQFRPMATFVDAVGVGAGVVDRLRMLNNEVIEVNAGSRASDVDTYFNKRIEMWDRMRKWLPGADLPNDPEMRSALIGIQYGFSTARGTGEVMMLEKKKDMKTRGLRSPDEGDALAHTFAEEMGEYGRSAFEPDPEEAFEP